MMRILSLVAALAGATSADAREPKKKADAAPPPAPVVEYENDAPQMAEALAEACLAAPPESETFDSRDNVLIAKLAGGGRAFIHFKSGCDANSMMFADKIAAEDGSSCVKPGAALVFTSSYGDQKKCVVDRINRWLDDELISPEYQ